MRKIVLALAAVAAIGIVIPTFAATPAEAHTVIVTKKKVHRDHGRHYGHNHYGWDRRWQHRDHRHHHRHHHHNRRHHDHGGR